MSLITWLIALVLGLTSSSGATDAEQPPAPTATEPPASAEPFPADLGPLRTRAEIEQRFLTRSPIAACDVVSAEVGDPALGDPSTFDCLRGAVDTEDGAELVVLSSDVDGQPAAVYLRVNPGGPMEVFVDRRDGESGPAWQYQRCPVPAEITGPCR
jgi:hypothetical protein